MTILWEFRRKNILNKLALMGRSPSFSAHVRSTARRDRWCEHGTPVQGSGLRYLLKSVGHTNLYPGFANALKLNSLQPLNPVREAGSFLPDVKKSFGS
jgi:hypothetical protein